MDVLFQENNPDQIYELPSPTAAIEVLRLLLAVDTFPRGGLYSGFYCNSAASRYEVVWLGILKEHVSKGGDCPIPPLDVAFAWFMHRQFPVSYANSTVRRCGRAFHPPREAAFAFGTGEQRKEQRREGSGNVRELWKNVAGEMPIWPPPTAGSDFDIVSGNNDWRPTLGSQLANSMSRISSLLHSWLRPHFLDPVFLDRARNRYGRFLELLVAHPDLTLVPAADIALMWHTHLGLSGDYAAIAKAAAVKPGAGSSGSESLPIRPLYLDLDGSPLRVAYKSTARLYEQTFGELYDCSDTAWVRPSEPHPLAGAASPLAFALMRAFDDFPSAIVAAGEDGAADTNLPHAYSGRPMSIFHPSRRGSNLSGRSGAMRHNPLSPGAPSQRSMGLHQRTYHPRAGAHALFAAWLVSTSAAEFFNLQTCHGLCFGGSWSIKVAAVEKMVTPLVLLPYMRGLPDSSDHPFLTAVTQRRGVWQPPLEPPAVVEAAVEQQDEQGGGEEEEGSRGNDSAVPGSRKGTGFCAAGGTSLCRGVSISKNAAAVEAAAAMVAASRPGGNGSGGAADGGAAATVTSGCSFPIVKEVTARTRSDPQVKRIVANSSCSSPLVGERSDGGAKGRGFIYSGGSFRLGDAEEFVDDAAMWGLRELMEQSVASGEIPQGDPLWCRSPREEDEEDAPEFGYLSPTCSFPPGSGPEQGMASRRQLNGSIRDSHKSAGMKCLNVERYGAMAPLWNILRKPEYVKRARALFRHLWVELGRRGLEHPLLKQQSMD